jgi:alanine racemase
VSAAVGADGRLTIDAGAIAANWRRLAVLAGGECGAAVKADAYGTGIDIAVPALHVAGCRTFFVAQLDEGRQVRQLAPDAIIYVLNGFSAETGDAYAQADLRPVLNSEGDVFDWSRFVGTTGWQGRAALHVDTGMNRLGLSADAARTLVPAVPNLALQISHLACAEDRDHPLNALQIAAFARLREAFPHLPASLANSSGLFLREGLGFDLARPGYALYGGNPTPGASNPMTPVVTLEARILQVRTVEKGETVGYGGTWRAGRRSLVAVLGLGYADGFPRTGSSRDDGGAFAAIAGTKCPVVGRISMDLTAVDVTDCPDGTAERGSWAEIIGPTIGLDEAARGCGTIGYELLTSLGRRYRRVVA